MSTFNLHKESEALTNHFCVFKEMYTLQNPDRSDLNPVVHFYGRDRLLGWLHLPAERELWFEAVADYSLILNPTAIILAADSLYRDIDKDSEDQIPKAHGDLQQAREMGDERVLDCINVLGFDSLTKEHCFYMLLYDIDDDKNVQPGLLRKIPVENNLQGTLPNLIQHGLNHELIAKQHKETVSLLGKSELLTNEILKDFISLLSLDQSLNTNHLNDDCLRKIWHCCFCLSIMSAYIELGYAYAFTEDFFDHKDNLEIISMIIQMLPVEYKLDLNELKGSIAIINPDLFQDRDAHHGH